MAAHHKDEEQDLGGTEKLASYRASQHLSCVCHIVDVWMGELELANHEAGVGCEDTETQDEDDAPSGRWNQCGFQAIICWIWTYGTRPILARVEGSERMPRDMVSAIMIMPAILSSVFSFST